MVKETVVIAGGGTGGHIYPGLALAEELKKTNPDIQVHFVGAPGGLEEKIVPKHGYPLHLLSVGRLHHSVGLFRRLKSTLQLPISFFQSLTLYFRLRPRWVLGIGGFASGPFVFTSAMFGGRTAILEPNAYPGLANRWLAKVVNFCFVVFKDTSHYFPKHKVDVVGLPVRIKKQLPQHNFSGQRPFRILVFGGSQGSRAINNVFGEWVEHLGERGQDFQICHQIGSTDFKQWQERYSNKHKLHLEYLEYIDDMPVRLTWADLVICRSGIGSVAEVAMCSKAAIFIPLPTAADNHQFKNAEALVQQQAAFMIEQKDLTWQKLDEQIVQLKNNPEQLNRTMDNLKQIDYSSAQQQILQKLMRG